ncbi:MAG: SMC family ATPase [Nanoarchaeota archaeon]|nr:SMC family ATPase [Nanoarchaeota archaeon]
MIISKLKLHNIRSYKEEHITFLDNITFLSGDIGSGKSSILQAIEFALFGFKRGDLEGFHILRKGESKGEVTLTLLKNSNEISITRKIKKTKQGIVQENGFFNQEELSPTELTAKIFETLNFPKEFLTKDRNLLYRFSTYTPQEQLKEILYAEHEKRLEIIRKLFQVDKYKQLQTTSDLYLKDLRDRKIFLQGSIGTNQDLEEEYNTLTEEIKQLEKKQDEELKLITPYQDKITLHKEKQQSVKNKLELYTDKQLEYEKKLTILQNYKEQKKSLLEEIKTYNQKEHKKLQEDKKEELTKNNLTLKELEKQLFEKTKQLNEHETRIKEFNIIKEKREKKEVECKIKENQLDELKKLLRENQSIIIKSRIKDIDVLSVRIKQKINKLEKKELSLNKQKDEIKELEILLGTQKASLTHKNEHLQNTYSLSSCDVCLQDVSIAQKQHIKESLQTQIKSLEKEIEINDKKVTELKSTLDLHELELKEKNELEIQLISLQDKKKHQEEELEKEKQKHLEYEGTYKNIEKEITLLKQQQKEKEKHSFEDLETMRKELQEEINSITKKHQEKELLAKELTHILEKEKKKEQEVIKYQEKIEKINNALQKEEKIKESLKKVKDAITLCKNNSEKLQNLLDKLTLKKQELDLIAKETSTTLNSKKQEYKKIQVKLEHYKKQKQELEVIEKEYSFIEKQVIPGSSTIEKTLFTKFWVEFNEHFIHIFKELIEDQEFDVYLREDFSIVVEQNGYEIDISNLSGGEKSSLAVSYRLALKKIIESNLGKETMLDVLILDEPTDGFSEQQVSRLGYLLKESGVSQILLVSHDEKIESIATNHLHVEKRHHESKITS